jgi:hypothetical protein
LEPSAEIPLYIGLDELVQPRRLRELRERVDYPLVGPVGEVDDSPHAQGLCLVAADRVLYIKDGLMLTGP